MSTDARGDGNGRRPKPDWSVPIPESAGYFN